MLVCHLTPLAMVRRTEGRSTEDTRQQNPSSHFLQNHESVYQLLLKRPMFPGEGVYVRQESWEMFSLFISCSWHKELWISRGTWSLYPSSLIVKIMIISVSDLIISFWRSAPFWCEYYSLRHQNPTRKRWGRWSWLTSWMTKATSLPHVARQSRSLIDWRGEAGHPPPFPFRMAFWRSQ